MDLEKELLRICVNLYSKLYLPRSDISYFINTLIGFTESNYNSYLKKTFQESFSAAISWSTEDVLKIINVVLSEATFPLKKFNSDDKRLTYFKKAGLYREPELYEIGKAPSVKGSNENRLLFYKSINVLHISVQHSLTRLLQMDGLFDALLSYMNNLSQQNTKVIENFVQGNLWKSMLKNFNKTDGTIIPLVVGYDDVETGNALGSHAGVNEIGAVYATVPCFPPNFASKLQSIIVTDIFLSSDRKECSNKETFKQLIKELISLRNNGFEIFVNGKRHKIYAITALIIGDFLGLNSILGFTSSFSKVYSCTECYASPEQIASLIEEDTSILRTVEQYEQDVKTLNLSKTGVKEPCVFSEIPGVNPIDNGGSDFMHMFPEGFANYDLAMIILSLICEYECFDIKYLNHQLKTMDFGYENNNRPLEIDLDYLKRIERLKMTASESLFMIRYLGLLVGNKVPEDNEVWQLYIRLRRIADILSSPRISEGMILTVEYEIKKHHTLFKEKYGNFKFKYHKATHFHRKIRDHGPPIHVSCMKFEHKHQELKTALDSTTCRINYMMIQYHTFFLTH